MTYIKQPSEAATNAIVAPQYIPYPDAASVNAIVSPQYVSFPAGVSDPIHAISGLVLDLDFDDASTLVITAGDVESVVNKVSSVVWSEATARPDYDATGINGAGCAIGTGTQKIISTEAAVVAALTDAHAYTIFAVLSYTVADASGAFFGIGRADGTASTRLWGQFTTGNGRQRAVFTNAASSTVALTGATDINTNPHVIEWFSPGTTGSCSTDGAAADPNAGAHDPGTLTPLQAAILCKPDSIPDTFGSLKLGRLVLFNRELAAPERSIVRVALGAQFGITVTP